MTTWDELENAGDRFERIEARLDELERRITKVSTIAVDTEAGVRQIKEEIRQLRGD